MANINIHISEIRILLNNSQKVGCILLKLATVVYSLDCNVS